jgi:hypothetical protein
MLNIALSTPMPRARQSTATSVKAGLRTKLRTARRTSRIVVSLMMVALLPGGPAVDHPSQGARRPLLVTLEAHSGDPDNSQYFYNNN